MTDKERIEELERENEKLKEIRAYNDFVTLGTTIDGVYFKPEQIIVLNNIKEIREFNQNQKAVEALQKVKECCNETFYVGNGFSKPQTLKNVKYYVDQLIKELGGKE